jgi:hypothetical protein
MFRWEEKNIELQMDENHEKQDVKRGNLVTCSKWLMDSLGPFGRLQDLKRLPTNSIW